MKNLHSYNLQCKATAQDEHTYVFDVAKCRGPELIFAASLSTNDIQLYSLEELKCLTTLKGHKETVTGIKFDNNEKNKLFSSSLDGSVCIWDTRQKGDPVATLIDDSDATVKYFTSFDVNYDGCLLCAGTELVHEDSFLVFWDARSLKILGGYWNSHTDDITQVKFHPNKSSIMSSGATDGLINIFDLSKGCEDDALQTTLNTGSSVGKLNWCNIESGDRLSCITHTEEHQLWSIEEAKPSNLFNKDNFVKSSKTNIVVDYLVDTFVKENSLYLATGTYSGDLQIWTFDEEKFSLYSELKGGHTSTVRTILWNDQSEMFITGGEDGFICCWESNPNSNSLENKLPKTKITSHLKQLSIHHKKKPY